MRTLLLLLFSLAWAAVGFGIIRALVIAWGFHRRFATVTAFAVAAAFVLGTAMPWSLSQRISGPVPVVAPAGAPHPIGCPGAVKVAASPGQGHIDVVFVGGKQLDVSKPIAAPRGAVIRFNGWVVATNGPATALCVLVDHRPVTFEGSYGLDRPDVATAVGKPEDRAAGFDLSLHLAPGSHVVTLGPVQSDGSLTLIAQPLQVQVR